MPFSPVPYNALTLRSLEHDSTPNAAAAAGWIPSIGRLSKFRSCRWLRSRLLAFWHSAGRSPGTRRSPEDNHRSSLWRRADPVGRLHVLELGQAGELEMHFARLRIVEDDHLVAANVSGVQGAQHRIGVGQEVAESITRLVPRDQRRPADSGWRRGRWCRRLECQHDRMLPMWARLRLGQAVAMGVERSPAQRGPLAGGSSGVPGAAARQIP